MNVVSNASLLINLVRSNLPFYFSEAPRMETVVELCFYSLVAAKVRD